MRMFLICLIVIFWISNLYPQQVSREEVMASYIINFAKNIEWLDEDEIDEFHIMVISSDSKLINELDKISKRRRVKNKAVKIAVKDHLTAIDNVQLVFIVKDKEEFTEECFDLIEGKNILLVTENYSNKKVVMVNFYNTPDQHLRFEINKANIINQGLTVLPDMVLLGGTEIDVAKLYRESQVSLHSMQKEMEKLENDLSNLQNQIDNRNMEITLQQEIIKKQAEEFSSQQKQLIDQRTELQGLFQSVKRQKAILEQQAVMLEQQAIILRQREQELSEKSDQIQKSNEVLTSQHSIISEHASQIKSQQMTIEEQGVVISSKQQMIYVLGVITVLILILIITIYLGYQNKQKANKLLIAEITERMHAEAALHIRTEELARSNKELEAFSYSVSHDLRTPLRSIDGFSQILLSDYEDKLDHSGINYLQRISAATLHMAQLIDDILSLSRISRKEMSVQQVNLSELANEIINNLVETQPERQVVLNIQEDVCVNGDRGLLRIMLENLIGNAWKFTSKNVVGTIEFGTFQQEIDQVYFIRDNGAGFDMKFAHKLFGAFQRLHSSKEFIGTGIGLAIVQRIVHRHDGRLWAEGAIEKGATFYFTLPLE